MEFAFSLGLVFVGAVTIGYALGYAQLAAKGLI
jgi:hypothetical protein